MITIPADASLSLIEDARKFVQKLSDDEYIFFKNNIVIAGEDAILYGRLLAAPEQREIFITNTENRVVASLTISGGLSKNALENFDASVTVEYGVLLPMCTIRIPDDLSSGAYFIDNTYVLFVSCPRNNIQASVVLPLLTLQIFSNFGGYSWYQTKTKKCFCSLNRPLKKEVLLGNVYVSPVFLNYITRKLQQVFFLDEGGLDLLPRQPKLVIVIGRSEYWTLSSINAFKKFVSSGTHVLLVSSETMWRHVTVNRDDCTILGEVDTWSSDLSVRDIVAVNPHDGGFISDAMRSDMKNPYKNMHILDSARTFFAGADIPCDTIELHMNPYDGLPVASYASNGIPELEPLDSTTWESICLHGYAYGADSPERKISAFATCVAKSGGTLVHMGSTAWTRPEIFSDVNNPGFIILDKVVDWIVKRCGYDAGEYNFLNNSKYILGKKEEEVQYKTKFENLLKSKFVQDFLPFSDMRAYELYRFGKDAYIRGDKLVSNKCEGLNKLLNNCYIKSSCDIGYGTIIAYGGIGILIHPQAKIGNFCNLGTNITLGHKPTIGDFCYISTGVRVIKSVTIGDFVIIGANAVINKDIPSFSVVGGVPGKIINKITCDNLDKYISFFSTVTNYNTEFVEYIKHEFKKRYTLNMPRK